MLNKGSFRCMKLLSNCKILVVGGNGFVGNCIANKFVEYSRQSQVSVLSRRGPRYSYPQNKQINWIIGDAMEPQRIKNKINQANIIVHCVATLIDTSVTKLRMPGEGGTYQQMNRDTFLKILSVLQSPKKVILISAVGHPPFLQRYITTKLQAEEALFKSAHNGYVIRPGFIYDWKLRKWSIPLKHMIHAWNKIYPSLYGMTRNGTYSQKLMTQLKQGQPTNLQHIAESIVWIAQHDIDKKIIQNEDLKSLSMEFNQKFIRGEEDGGKERQEKK